MPRPIVASSVLLCVISLAGSAGATHSTFSYTVDYFAQGGAQGGFFDDFSDGLLSPWVQNTGTAVDSGSGLVLSDPGTDITVESPFWTGEESRDVSSAHRALGLADGNGDFMMETLWTTGAPLENQLWGMGLTTSSGDELHTRVYSIHILNLSAELGARATHPLAAGIYVWFQAATLLAGFPDLVLDLDADPASSGHLVSITDPLPQDVLLVLAFDDVSDQLTASIFDWEGGGELASLAPQTLETGWIHGGANLGADPFQVVPEPSTALLLAVGLAGLASRRRQPHS